MASAPCAAKRPGDLDRVVGVDAARRPVGRRDPHGHRPVRRPHLAYGVEDLEREAQPVGQRAAVLVGALVGQRREERREQVAVRAVQLEQVEARARRRAAAAATNCSRIASSSARSSSRGTWLTPGEYGSGEAPTSGQLPVRQRLVDALPHQLRRALAAGVAELQPIFASDVARARSRRSAARRPPARRCRCPVQPGVIRPSGETHTISVITRPGAAERLAAQVDEVEVAGHAVARPSTCPSGRRRRGCASSRPRSRNGLEHRRPHVPRRVRGRRTSASTSATNSGSRSRRLS